MRWNEMSKLQKIVSVVGAASGIVFIVLAVLVWTHVLPDIRDIARMFLGISFVAPAVLCWNTQRSVAIIWMILGASNILDCIVCLLT